MEHAEHIALAIEFIALVAVVVLATRQEANLDRLQNALEFEKTKSDTLEQDRNINKFYAQREHERADKQSALASKLLDERDAAIKERDEARDRANNNADAAMCRLMEKSDFEDKLIKLTRQYNALRTRYRTVMDRFIASTGKKTKKRAKAKARARK